VAALYFANRLVQLPLSLFGAASAQASLPALAEQAAHEDWEAFRSTLLSLIRMVGFVIIPSSVALIVLAFPLVRGLLERGAFDHEASVMTAQALMCYAVGLWSYSVSKVLTGAFYALRETRTPVVLAAEAVGVNLLLSLALMWPLKVSGLALAAAISSTFNVCRLLARLERRLGGRPLLRPLAGGSLRIIAAAGLMGAGCWTLWRFAGLGAAPAWLGLPCIIGIGVALYALSCTLVGVQELSTMLRWITRLPFLQRFASE
jgi:putative peptidoglycan lipid II flippase